MNSLIMTLCMCLPSQQQHYNYSDLIVEAFKCSNAKEEKINPEIIATLSFIENDFFLKHNIPVELRGMLLAAACNESGYNPKAKGDWRAAKSGKKYPMAKGILQFWPWAEKEYKFVRGDYRLSARFWMTHIAKQRKKDRCPDFFSELKKWVGAWTQAIRGKATKKNKYHCYSGNKHYKRLKKWHKRIDSRNDNTSSK